MPEFVLKHPKVALPYVLSVAEGDDAEARLAEWAELGWKQDKKTDPVDVPPPGVPVPTDEGK